MTVRCTSLASSHYFYPLTQSFESSKRLKLSFCLYLSRWYPKWIVAWLGSLTEFVLHFDGRNNWNLLWQPRKKFTAPLIRKMQKPLSLDASFSTALTKHNIINIPFLPVFCFEYYKLLRSIVKVDIMDFDTSFAVFRWLPSKWWRFSVKWHCKFLWKKNCFTA